MADYTDLSTATRYIGGTVAFSGDDQALISTIITACSRSFDRETNRPINWWAPKTGVTVRYSGSGTQWQDIDEFDAIASITMSTTQNRSDATTLPIVPADPTGYTPTPNDVILNPLSGPPYDRLFLLRGFLPDAYDIGNIAVTGNQATPPEIADAVAIWVAYRWKRMRADWADRVSIPSGPSLQWQSGGRSGGKGATPRDELPAEVRRAIDYFTGEVEHGPKLDVVTGGDNPRLSPWLGWRT